jgi:hypothetical protein
MIPAAPPAGPDPPGRSDSRGGMHHVPLTQGHPPHWPDNHPPRWPRARRCPRRAAAALRHEPAGHPAAHRVRGRRRGPVPPDHTPPARPGSHCLPQAGSRSRSGAARRCAAAAARTSPTRHGLRGPGRRRAVAVPHQPCRAYHPPGHPLRRMRPPAATGPGRAAAPALGHRDRALNRAIHAIALVRMRSCPRTRAYITRRATGPGLTYSAWLVNRSLPGSPRVRTSRPSRRACGMPVPRPPSTPTGTSGPTETSPPAPRSRPFLPPGRNRAGTVLRQPRNIAGHGQRSGYASKYSSNSCGCGRSLIGSISLDRL